VIVGAADGETEDGDLEGVFVGDNEGDLVVLVGDTDGARVGADTRQTHSTLFNEAQSALSLPCVGCRVWPPPQMVALVQLPHEYRSPNHTAPTCTDEKLAVVYNSCREEAIRTLLLFTTACPLHLESRRFV
jgi:hypothetical protein